MYTYTFPVEYFGHVMAHMDGMQNIIETLTLSNGLYTMTCHDHINEEQYDHMNELFGVVEIV